METTSPSQTGQGADRNTCYLCHGKGHWARDCTSLPSVFLVENPPRCYSCGGAGHYARFCPSVDPYGRRGIRSRVNSDPFPWIPPYAYSIVDPYLIDSPLVYYPPSSPMLSEEEFGDGDMTSLGKDDMASFVKVDMESFGDLVSFGEGDMASFDKADMTPIMPSRPTSHLGSSSPPSLMWKPDESEPQHGTINYNNEPETTY